MSFLKRGTAIKPLIAGIAIAMGVPAGMAVITPAAAQDYTSGSIIGTVTDTAGKPIEGATVTVHSNALGFTRTTTTSPTGGFRFEALAAQGTYTVTTSAAGYSGNSIPAATVQPSHSSAFSIALQSTTAATSTTANGVETVVVSGARQVFDFTSTTTGQTIDVSQLNKDLPVAHDLQSIMQLSPGTNVGISSSNFPANLTSISGSSVAESAYFINGLNITNFDTYLGASVVPFYFYKTIETKTGGYQAEYGRATGGVTNAVTKSGSNDFMAAVHVDWTPDALSSTSPNTYSAYNKGYHENDLDTTFEMSGPLIKDHLFAYGLMQQRQHSATADSITGKYAQNAETNSPFYGFKVDGYVNENHHLEFTYFDTAQKTFYTNYAFNPTSYAVGAQTAQSVGKSGGDSWVAKYTGNIFPWFTLSTAYGVNNDRSESIPLSGGSSLNYVLDSTTGYNGSKTLAEACNAGGATGSLCNAQSATSIDYPHKTKRKFYRVDADFFFPLLGDHHVRAGLDDEYDVLSHNTVRTGPAGVGLASEPQGGGVYYRYRDCAAVGAAAVTAAQCKAPGSGLTTTSDYVQIDYYNTGGSFKTVNNAFYIQDEWKLLDTGLTINLGFRDDEFHDYTAGGQQYVELTDNFQPRVGFSYNPWFDHDGRFFGSYDKYYLPVAANTAYREAAKAYYFDEYWTYTGVGANGVPILGKQLIGWAGAATCPFGLTSQSAGQVVGCNTTSNGIVTDPSTAVATNLAATAENEYILGYEHKFQLNPDRWFGGDWTVSVVATQRDLLADSEDTAVDYAVNNYAAANGLKTGSAWGGFSQYVIVNPGSSATVNLYSPLTNAAGAVSCGPPGTTNKIGTCTINFTAAQIGIPKAARHYNSVEFTFDRAWDGVWSANASYTWSRDYGNTEGYVISDRGTGGQTDAGISEDFDRPELEVGSTGYLGNDHDHTFKFRGNYQVIDNLLLGVAGSITSPFKQGCFGYYPYSSYPPGGAVTYGCPANAYGAAFYYCNGQLVPRGTGQRTDWEYIFNTSVRYNIEVPSGQVLTLRADVFNLFDFSAVDKRQETGEASAGVPSPYYGLPTVYQQPRYVRLGFDVTF